MARPKDAPNCYDCLHGECITGDAHRSCANRSAHVTGNEYGRRNGWFRWPVNFDPIWLDSCDGFEPASCDM